MILCVSCIQHGMMVQRVLHVLQEAQVQGIHAGREVLNVEVTLTVCCSSKMRLLVRFFDMHRRIWLQQRECWDKRDGPVTQSINMSEKQLI